MWDQGLTRLFGRFSLRNSFILAAAILAMCLAYLVLSAPAARAAAEATWKNGNIVYENHTYTPVAAAKKGDGTGLQPNTQIYRYVPSGQGQTTGNKTQKAYVIYFAPGISPPSATSADYQTFDFSSPDTYSHPGNPVSIDIVPTKTNPGTDSCGNPNINGVGWIVCPVTNFLAGGMDTIFSILTSFLQVQPVQSTTQNVLYRAWSYMRTFANIAFVIAFLIIIYSQLTNMGVSNYGIKKLLPRLIIAAVLVNVSYWICAVAIDVSNILGYSIQDLFIYMRNHLVGAEGNNWNTIGWKALADVVLAGGGTIVGLGGAAIAFTGAGAGVVYMLLPVLAGVITAAFVAVIVLAARQAIITVMVILAPLAFVAYLLPNTEKYFGKWRELFMTMLLMFPIFSLIFGGSQLAGTAIIQAASGSSAVFTILFGMAVQVAPVVITPTLIRFSGSMLGRIAGMINNPKKGLVDRTKNFSKDRIGNYQAQRMKRLSEAQQKRIASGRKPSAYTRAALYRENSRRKREGTKKANESYAEATWENSADAHAIHNISAEAGLLKEQGESAAQAAFERLKHTDARIQALDQNVRVNKLKLDVSKAKVDANWEELKAGNIDSVIQPESLSNDALRSYLSERKAMAYNVQADALMSRVEERRAHEAKEVQNADYARELVVNEAMRQRAGGINEHGADSVLANAIAAERKTYNENVADKLQLIKHFNLSSQQRQALALGGEVTALRDDGTSFTFKGPEDIHAREAATEEQLATGSFGQIQTLIEESSRQAVDRDANGNVIKNADGSIRTHAGVMYDLRTTISAAIPKNSIPNKAIYYGSKSIDDVSKGEFMRERAEIYNIVNGKVKDQVLAGMDGDALANMFNDANLRQFVDPADMAAYTTNRQNMINATHRILSNTTLAGSLSDSARKVITDIRDHNPRTDTPPPTRRP